VNEFISVLPRPMPVQSQNRQSSGLPVLRAPPPPLVDRERKIIVLWSPKSACTTIYVWFSQLCGFLDEVLSHPSPHNHRMDVFRSSQRYLESLASDTSDFRVVRIIRDPYARAVSIFREALVGWFADRDAALAGLNFDTGVSFQRFLLMVDRFDMENVDTHYRPQLHPFESERKPDTIVNISKSHLFAELNALEKSAGWPLTDFASMEWLHALERSRRAPPYPQTGADLFRTPIRRGKPKEQTAFPEYDSLLTPEAKALIESIYRNDFTAYRDFL
jgi:hypothetical protein